MRRDTHWTRIFASVAATLAALLLLAGLAGQARIRAFHREEVTRRAEVGASLMEDWARDVLAGRVAAADAQRWAASLRDPGRLRLSCIDATGRVLVDSEAPPPLPDHAARPEFVAAMDAGRGEDVRLSATTGLHTLYVARRITDGGRTLGVVRTAASLDRAEQEVASLREALALAGLGALAVGLAASVLLARRLARPLEEVERLAAQLAAGDHEGRVVVDGPEEVRRLAAALNRMNDALRGRVIAEASAREHLETVMAGMLDGVVAVDARERVLLMNRAAADLLGQDAPLATADLLWERVRFPALERSLREALAGARPERVDAPAPGTGGRTLEIAVGPLASGGAVAILRDVSEVRRLERMRMDFVANVSHELRTPLASLRGALETLADPGEDPAARARFLEIAERNAGRLQALVSDLLDLSAIEAEEDRMPLDTVDFHGILRAAVGALAGVALERRVALVLEPPPEAPVLVGAHSRRLEQALSNLVENAVKYTPAGGRVVVRLFRRGDVAVAEVEDTGVGIPAAALPRIFERFYRVDPSRSREMGGTGLGLAIVKHVVRAHRGQVEVRSAEGGGTLFSVLLPVRPPGDAAPPGDRE